MNYFSLIKNQVDTMIMERDEVIFVEEEGKYYMSSNANNTRKIPLKKTDFEKAKNYYDKKKSR